MKHLDQYKILVAEDDHDTRQVLMEFLISLGFRPNSVEDGYSLLKKIKSDLPDLLILDIMMPRMDGFAVLEKLKTEKLNPKIIISSALSDKDSILRAKSYDVLDYVAKPFDLNDLRQKIEKLLHLPLQNGDLSTDSTFFAYTIENPQPNIVYIHFEGLLNPSTLIPLKVQLPRAMDLLEIKYPIFIFDIRDTFTKSFNIESASLLMEILLLLGVVYFSQVCFITSVGAIIDMFKEHHQGKYVRFASNKVEALPPSKSNV